MITKTDTLLSKALLEKGLVNADILEKLVEEASKSKESLSQVLLKKNAVSEEDLLKNLATVLKVSFVGMEGLKPDPVVIEKVPLKVAEYYKMAPLKLEKRKLTIAVSTPLELRTQDDIRAHLGYEIEIVLAKERDVSEAIKRFYGFAAGTIGEMMAQTPQMPTAQTEQTVEKIDNLEKMAGDATIAKLVNQIILEAFRKRATDIHLEPYRGKMKLRYRIDGTLYDAHVQTDMHRFILPILSRVKIMSNLNIVEKRLPQDGRAIVKIEDTTLDLRVSSIPTPNGESVVIRLLPMNRVFDLKQLGLSEDQRRSFEDIIEKPHGIVFITGPTGSGKSTTLYACLHKLNTDERKIITIEDPVEYEMEGVTQIQVMSTIGLDFARGLRSILRHDPDVIMVGEVRDLETAEIAIRVALTGHLVFSTLHTNDAASGITRLVDIGIQPYLVASSVEAFIAQRLVRTICPDCKEEDKSPMLVDIKKQIVKDLGLKKETVSIYHGKGCDHCNGSGFWGRVAIYEILLVTEKIKQMIMKKAPASEIKKVAQQQGMRTLKQDGWLKVIDGLTTPKEILEVAEAEKQDSGSSDEAERSTEVSSQEMFTMSQFKPSDRRIFIRLDQTVNVRYRVIKTPPDIQEMFKKVSTAQKFTVTKNISAGGLVFVSKEKLPMGAILDLQIELPDSKEPIQCLGKIVREETKDEESIYEAAVCFLDLSSSLRSRFERFIDKEKGQS